MTNLIQTGLSLDNKLIIGNVFRFHETHGIPLDILFNCLIDRNSIPDWISFYNEAVAAGMQHIRIISKLSEAIDDSFGTEYRTKIISKLNMIFNKSAV